MVVRLLATFIALLFGSSALATRLDKDGTSAQQVRELVDDTGPSDRTIPESALVIPLTPFQLAFDMKNGAATSGELDMIESLVDAYLNAYVKDTILATSSHPEYELIIVQTSLLTHFHGEKRGILFVELESVAAFDSTSINPPEIHELNAYLEEAFQPGAKGNFLGLLEYLPFENFFRVTYDVQFSFAPADDRTTATVRSNSPLSLVLTHYNLLYVLPENKHPSAIDVLALEQATGMYLMSFLLEETRLSQSFVEEFSTVVVEHTSNSPGHITVRYESVLHLRPDSPVSIPTIEELDAIRQEAFAEDHFLEYVTLLDDLPSTNVFVSTLSVYPDGMAVTEDDADDHWFYDHEILLIVIFAVGITMVLIGVCCYCWHRRKSQRDATEQDATKGGEEGTTSGSDGDEPPVFQSEDDDAAFIQESYTRSDQSPYRVSGFSRATTPSCHSIQTTTTNADDPPQLQYQEPSFQDEPVSMHEDDALTLYENPYKSPRRSLGFSRRQGRQRENPSHVEEEQAVEDEDVDDSSTLYENPYTSPRKRLGFSHRRGRDKEEDRLHDDDTAMSSLTGISHLLRRANRKRRPHQPARSRVGHKQKPSKKGDAMRAIREGPISNLLPEDQSVVAESYAPSYAKHYRDLWDPEEGTIDFSTLHSVATTSRHTGRTRSQYDEESKDLSWQRKQSSNVKDDHDTEDAVRYDEEEQDMQISSEDEDSDDDANTDVSSLTGVTRIWNHHVQLSLRQPWHSPPSVDKSKSRSKPKAGETDSEKGRSRRQKYSYYRVKQKPCRVLSLPEQDSLATSSTCRQKPEE